MNSVHVTVSRLRHDALTLCASQTPAEARSHLDLQSSLHLLSPARLHGLIAKAKDGVEQGSFSSWGHGGYKMVV